VKRTRLSIWIAVCVVATAAVLGIVRPAAATGGSRAYRGGVDGAGVLIGSPKVYLVFMGSEWGTPGVDTAGDLTFSSDPLGGAPRLQELYKGLGTGGEQWSGIMTQYCDGVPAGTTTCGAGDSHIGMPTGDVLAGVWYDNAVTVPDCTSGQKIADEAVRAALHFNNTTAAPNRSAQYVIATAHGTKPDQFGELRGQCFGGNFDRFFSPPLYWSTGDQTFCAWHDWTLDRPGLFEPDSPGAVAFTLLPYVMDNGAPCGMNFVNPGGGGTLDGYTMAAGHEYAAALTDPYPYHGWIGGPDGPTEVPCFGGQNVTTGTGTFPLPSIDSNNTGNCELAMAPAIPVTTSCWTRLTDHRPLFIAAGATVYQYESNSCPGTGSPYASVSVHIQHDDVSDLVVDLVAPSGRTFSLWNRGGHGGHTIDQTVTLDLSNENQSGTWALRIRDAFPTSTGTLTSFGIDNDVAVVPAVIGDFESFADDAIARANLTVGTVTRVTSSAPVGSVLSQSPDPGTAVRRGSPVSFTVSLGGVSVPDVLGLSQSDATGALTAAGLTVQVSFNDDCVSPGDVELQSPSGGAVVPPGSAVTIRMSTCSGGGIEK
jgi:Proprotein convertase P-domain/PASTA domain